MSLKVEIVRYKTFENGPRIAVATIKIPGWGNLLIEGVSFFLKGSSKWTSFPSRKGDDGKYWPYLHFEKKETKQRFDHLLWEALDDKIAKGKSTESYPDLPEFL